MELSGLAQPSWHPWFANLQPLLNSVTALFMPLEAGNTGLALDD
jgi:hypothetical protein